MAPHCHLCTSQQRRRKCLGLPLAEIDCLREQTERLRTGRSPPAGCMPDSIRRRVIVPPLTKRRQIAAFFLATAQPLIRATMRRQAA